MDGSLNVIFNDLVSVATPSMIAHERLLYLFLKLLCKTGSV